MLGGRTTWNTDQWLIAIRVSIHCVLWEDRGLNSRPRMVVNFGMHMIQMDYEFDLMQACIFDLVARQFVLGSTLQ